MATVTLHNTFHDTTANVRPDGDGTVSHRVARRVWRELCGVEGCACGGNLGERPAISRPADSFGERYNVEGD